MRHLPRDADFLAESRQPIGIFCDLARQELQRDGLAEREVFGPVHFAHAAPAEQGDDPVAAGEHRARDEAGFIERRGGGWADNRRASDRLCLGHVHRGSA